MRFTLQPVKGKEFVVLEEMVSELADKRSTVRCALSVK
jgi:hypothetical protein